MSATVSSVMIDSPLGPVTLVAAGGALTGLYLDGRVPGKVLTALDAAAGSPAAANTAAANTAAANTAAANTDEAAGGAGSADAAVLEEAARQLAEYFDGRRRAFDLPLALEGTPFQRRVWEALLGVGYGETVSYGYIADRIGQPTAVRAVGHANGRNPVSIIVPCHRVVGSSGSLTGYGGGLENKARLLDLERRVSSS